MRINQRFWFLLHGWFSLPIWLLFCFICLTGTIAVISHELTWLTNPLARANNPQNLPAKPIPELIAAVQQQVPDADVGHVMVLEPYLVTAVSFASKDLPAAIAYVNPYTADVQMINQGITFIGFMRTLHGWLLFPWQHNYSIGYYLVSAMSLVVLGALITGLVVYKRFWQAYTGKPRLRFASGARVWLGDLHRLAGAWSLWFLLIIGLTGLWYLVQAMLWHNEVELGPETAPIAMTELPASAAHIPQRIAFAQAYDTALQTLPALQPAWISLPEHNRDYFSIAGAGDNFLFDQYAYRVQVNPWTGAVVSIQTPTTMTGLQTLAHIADPLHYGTIGGIWTKLLWFVFGLILTGMSITGFLIWSKRTFKTARESHRPDKPRRRRPLAASATRPEEAAPEETVHKGSAP
ncbi:MAG: PepSY-associated TM helix domain-containing protein [Pseudomonadota bacterium]